MTTIEGHECLSGDGPAPAPPKPAPRASLRRNLAPPAHRTKIVPDRRLHQRVNVPLTGRFMRADKHEYPCQAINISAGGMALLAPIAGEPGERIVVYLDNMGRFEGELVRVFPGGFAIKLAGTAHKREKIANQLTWLVNKSQLDLDEYRAHERLVPQKQNMKLVMSDGSQRDCRILDVSLGGASVSVLPKPDIGEAVTLGLVRGTVVRHHDQGIGIRFLEIQDPSTIELQFG